MKLENGAQEVIPLGERVVPRPSTKSKKPPIPPPKRLLQKETQAKHADFNDLTALTSLNEETVLQCVEARYKAGVYYTWAGLPLVAVNPFHEVAALYDEEVEEKYRSASASESRELPPHIYAVGQKAYCDLKRGLETSNQSIIVSGESGAGKTWTTRSLMQFISDMTGMREESGNDVSLIEQRILDSNPVLEAFGNACTTRNENSSRFGKYIQLQFNRQFQIVGAKLKTYLLEKTRVVHQAEGERNFHIFYQMSAGMAYASRSTSKASEKARRRSSRWGGVDHQAFVETREAMRNIGIHDEQQDEIFKVLSGIKQICAVDFAKEEDACIFTRPEKAREASALLSVCAERLAQCLSTRRITSKGTGEVFMKPCSVHESEARRDCVAKVIYARLFDWIVDFINTSIKAPRHSKHAFIGLLDVYGFESFLLNSLEQLCINYANEKLQQHFVLYFLKRQQDEYQKEGVDWDFQEFVDNRPCLDLLESRSGVFALLNEECRLNRPVDNRGLSDRLNFSLRSNTHFSQLRQRSQSPNFVIHHYADSVCYEVEGLVEKNKDHTPDDLLELLQTSDSWLIQVLFPTDKSDTEKNVGNVHKPRPTNITVVSKFKTSLDKLMSSLKSTNAHYIRCVKPNTLSDPGTFDREQVLGQLRACGVIETIRISAAGYPIRLTHREFITRYNFAVTHIKPSLPLTPIRQSQASPSTPEAPDAITRLKKAERRSRRRRRSGYDHTPHICQSILAAVGCYGDDLKENVAAVDGRETGFMLGRTKIFLREHAMETLEGARERQLHKCAFSVQCCWRRYKRRVARRNNDAATVIQKVTRGWLARSHYQSLQRATLLIQRYAHIYLSKKRKQRTYTQIQRDDTEQRTDLPDQQPISSQMKTLSESLVSSPPILSPSSRPGSTAQSSHWFTPFMPHGHVYNSCMSRVLGLFGDVGTDQETHHSGGIASKRAIEKVPVFFHCRGTPLSNATTRPLKSQTADPGLGWLSSLT
ncbi:unconventional myosin-XIX [Nematostella vectensis]|uniref:unconventional myosin-XIX n=1 Tax=Nematostella vectensis TaxID=45351 RepID=UPI002077582E|nr:unconventional myosin-XIX [Nematostella vectensis]